MDLYYQCRLLHLANNCIDRYITFHYCGMKSCTIPHALRGKVELELQCLVEQAVTEPVETSKWATPIVPVMKPHGTVWICGDYRLTINRTAKPDAYPLPCVKDLFATLAGRSKETVDIPKLASAL